MPVLALVLRTLGHPTASYLVALAALIALPSVILVMMYGQSRIFFVMARDGLLSEKLADIHPKWKTLARNIARDMNLRYIGIDIMSTETLDKPPGDYVVIEINAAPGLDNYSAMGPRQKRIVEGLYRKALEALIK